MTISLIIPAYNESENIERFLTDLSNQDVFPDEILLICHRCTDDTEEKARNFLQKHADLSQKVKIISLSEGNICADARKFGFDGAEGDILFTTDVDCTLPKPFIRNIKEYFLKNPILPAAVGKVYFLNNFFFRVVMTFFFFSILCHIPIFRFLIGPVYGIRKKTYNRIGGFKNLNDIKKYMMEKTKTPVVPDDGFLTLLLRAHQQKIGFMEDVFVTTQTMGAREGENSIHKGAVSIWQSIARSIDALVRLWYLRKWISQNIIHAKKHST